MQIKNRFTFLLLLVFIISSPAYGKEPQITLTDSEIKNILQDRIDRDKQSVGIVVGLIDDKGTRIISYGKPTQDSLQSVDGDSVYEIGSITKVFTATLLADMVNRGEVKLNDPIAKYLPKSVKVPTRNGKQITLLNLTTHTSGLPRMPDNFEPKDDQNPYADYTVEQMYAFLSGYTLTRDPGAKVEYSNLGVGLLGHILALRAGTDYETLVKSRILEPLNMNHTVIRLTSDMQTHLATGHNFALKPVENWDIPTLAGAGALRSTAQDLLKFLAANLGLHKSPLLKAMQKTHLPRHNAGNKGVEIGMGWGINGKLILHNGETGGYHTFIGFDKKKRKGVVVLSNAINDIDDIGIHLLANQFSLAKIEAPKQHKAIKLDPRIFDAYVGDYQLAPDDTPRFIREGDRYFCLLPSQEKFEIFPESETEFFMKQ